MSTLPRVTGRRLTAFRLSDLPPEVLAKGKDKAMKAEDNFVERLKIGLAAEKPSQKVYWVSTKAWNKAMGEYSPFLYGRTEPL